MEMERIEKLYVKYKKELRKKLGLGYKTITLPYGVPGYGLKYVKRHVPKEEPPAWPVNERLAVVGKRVRRLDAYAKVTGSAAYPSDIRLPGMLYGKIVWSPHPHARIVSIDTRAAEKLPGVAAVYVLTEASGVAGGSRKAGGCPEIVYAGQPVVGIAAESMAIAEEAAGLVRIEYDPLPFVVDTEEAMRPGAPSVFEGRGSNVLDRKTEGSKEDVREGFGEAEVVVERTYGTQVQHHACTETHTMVVDYRPNDVTIYASTQSLKNVRNRFAAAFGISRSDVRVLCEFMGGGFGSKIDPCDLLIVAGHLSKRAGRPVSLSFGRKEEFLAAGNRPDSIQRLKIGAKRDGTLTAIELHAFGTAGVGSGAGVGNVARDLYRCPRFHSEQSTILTNAGPAKPFRAPGNVQGCFAVEQAMDELAEKLGLDPIVLRDRCDGSEIRRIQRIEGAKRFGWEKRKKAGSDDGVVRKGVGMAQALWPKYLDLDATAEVRIYRDGGIEIRAGVQDIGTGTKTILAQVVAEEFGMPPERITVRVGDTHFPVGPTSSGSKMTGSITPAARNAAYRAKMELFEQAAGMVKAKTSELRMENGYLYARRRPEKRFSVADILKKAGKEQITAVATRSENYEGRPVSRDLGAVQFAEVSVDTGTGIVKVERIVTAHSCGRPINIGQIESQIEGAVIQGLSYALYEERVMDRTTGFQMNADMDRYTLPFSMEIPEIDIVLIESYDAKSSTDASGIGEPPIIATAPAIANAVYNAIGVRIYDLPITPEKILKALGKIS